MATPYQGLQPLPQCLGAVFANSKMLQGPLARGLTYEWVMSHRWILHVALMKCVVSLSYRSETRGNVTHMNCVMSLCLVCRRECVLYLFCRRETRGNSHMKCVVSHLKCGNVKCVISLFLLCRRECVVYLFCQRETHFIRETWIIHMWDMTHSYVWHRTSGPCSISLLLNTAPKHWGVVYLFCRGETQGNPHINCVMSVFVFCRRESVVQGGEDS